MIKQSSVRGGWRWGRTRGKRGAPMDLADVQKPGPILPRHRACRVQLSAVQAAICRQMPRLEPDARHWAVPPPVAALRLLPPPRWRLSTPRSRHAACSPPLPQPCILPTWRAVFHHPSPLPTRPPLSTLLRVAAASLLLLACWCLPPLRH
eukprot:359695-Chlamydomonas_euryale.AAC.1